MDAYTITDSSCGSKSKWALVHLCTCKAAAKRSNVYVSGNFFIKILPIPETMQVISTSAESKEERSKKKKKDNILTFFIRNVSHIWHKNIYFISTVSTISFWSALAQLNKIMYIHFSLEDSNAILRILKFDRPFVVKLKMFGIKNPITFSRIIK